jgi:DNA-binding transcriptional LysR family regulator
MTQPKLLAPVTTRQLIYFIAVSEARSFRRAAEQLRMSQPPLTQQIQALERALDTELIDRTKRRIELTAAGVEFRDHAATVLTVMNKGLERTRAVGRGLSGRFRVGLTDDFIYSPVFSELLSFSRENPEVIVETYVGMSPTLLAEMSQHTLDLALTNKSAGQMDGTIVEKPLPPSRIMAVMHKSHRLAKRPGISPSDLVDEPLIHTPDNSTLAFARQVAGMFAEAGVVPRVVHRTTNGAVACRLAQEGLGIALVSEYSVGRLPGGLTCLAIRSKWRHEHVLLHHDQRLPPALERLIGALTA